MKRTLILASAAFILMGAQVASARSVTSDEIKKCTNERGSQVRLVCYDQLFREDADPSYSYEVGWKITEHTDAINDTPTVLAEKPSIDGEFALVFRCKRREIAAFVMRSIPWRGVERLSVTMRIDKELPVTTSWGLAADGRLARAVSPMSFTKWVLKASKLAIRLDSGGVEDTAIFELGETSLIASKLKAACPAEML